MQQLLFLVWLSGLDLRGPDFLRFSRTTSATKAMAGLNAQLRIFTRIHVFLVWLFTLLFQYDSCE